MLPEPTRLEQLVRRSALRWPDRPAVGTRMEVLSYAELEDLSCRAAQVLRTRGVDRGDRVVIVAEKSVHTVVAMIAAMKLGAAFIPVDPGNPPARIAKIVADARAVLTITGERPMPEVEGSLSMAELKSAVLEALPVAQDPPPGTDELAYILYTSGSTGTPKGVCISHRNALAFVEWAAEGAQLTHTDRLANHASFNFDLSVFDLYAAFLVGASVWLVPGESAGVPRVVAAFLKEHAISVLYCVPSLLTMMLEEEVLPLAGGSLRTIIFAGEPFPLGPLKTLRELAPSLRLFNYYGPTETNVCASYEVTASDLQRTDPIPIGTPASGARLWIRNDASSVADPGEEGELMVEGPTVMLGYWGHPALVRGGYATGDRVRRDASGLLYFLGREDSLVKVGGRRIDLGEIESTLSEREDVADAAVVVVQSGSARRLHAFVVPRRLEAPSLLEIKRFLAERLPSYMTVHEVVSIARLPRTARGKLDRTRLARIGDDS